MQLTVSPGVAGTATRLSVICVIEGCTAARHRRDKYCRRHQGNLERTGHPEGATAKAHEELLQAALDYPEARAGRLARLALAAVGWAGLLARGPNTYLREGAEERVLAHLDSPAVAELVRYAEAYADHDAELPVWTFIAAQNDLEDCARELLRAVAPVAVAEAA
jgi:hypothetical protein